MKNKENENLSLENIVSTDVVENFQEKSKDLEKKLSTLYFSIPEIDGKFKIENSTEHNDGSNFYGVEFEGNNTFGKLHFISGEFDKRAIDGIDFYLIPVCEIQNISLRKTANKIELIEPGEVFLNNDNWVVNPDKKVKIRFFANTNEFLEEKTKNVFYAEAPNEEDGSFTIERTTDIIIPNKSVFEFTMIDASNATFKIINDPDIMKRAINLYYRLLKPVCENKSAHYNESYNQIIFKRDKGKVAKQGDKWALMDKMIIKEFQ